MTFAGTDDLILPLAEDLLACLATEVAKVPVPPEQVCLRPGDLVGFLISTRQDECCSGLAWVRVSTFYPSANFPEPLETATVRGEVPSWVASLEMGVIRCAPTGDAEHLPTCTQWTDTTEAVLHDAAAMRAAYCCFEATRKGSVMPTPWEPFAVEGGCTGGRMELLVRVASCAC